MADPVCYRQNTEESKAAREKRKAQEKEQQ